MKGENMMADRGVKRITVDVPAEFHKQVKRRALDLGTTVSDVVRELLTEWLGKTEPEQTES
jgi:Arc/MetJ-type ribon-helix-helix transcriptional regulator